MTKKEKVSSCVVIDRQLKSQLKQYVAKNEVKGGLSAVVDKATRTYLKEHRC